MRKAIFAALAAALLIKGFLFDFMITEGQSMAPAIMPGTILVVNKMVYGLRLPGSSSYLARWARPKEGEVLVFLSPRGGLAVKRCRGLWGKDAFWAAGDNEQESYDSRSYGPVAEDRIIGRVWGRR